MEKRAFFIVGKKGKDLIFYERGRNGGHIRKNKDKLLGYVSFRGAMIGWNSFNRYRNYLPLRLYSDWQWGIEEIK